MTGGDLREAVVGGVLTVTFDRPEKRNALTIAMRQRLEELPERCNGDDGIRCVVITGAGGTFTAGADLAELREIDGPVPSTAPTAGLAAIECPVIAAVDGVCVTGGLELALACDLIVASRAARFADTHATLGVIPRWGMSQLLPARVGPARALDLMLTGRWVDADEAERIGLVDRVVADADFPAAVQATAATIAERDPSLTAAVRALIAGNASRAFTDALAAEADVGAAFGLED